MRTAQRFVDPDYSSLLQSGSQYPINIDRCISVLARLAAWFAPHQAYAASPNPDMAVEIDEGYVWDGTTLLHVPAQIVTGFTIPAAGQHRVDRIVIDADTGVASRVAGTAVTGSPSAVAPSIDSGKIPNCQILITASDTVITNSMITDERVLLTSAPPIVTGSPRGYIDGCILTNDVSDATNDFAISAGVCRDSGNAADITETSSIIKRTDANWSLGSGGGALDNGVVGNGTFWVYRIRRPDTGVVDACVSRSAVAPDIGGSPSNIPAAYTQYRRIGALLREGGTIVPFTQIGDKFWRKTPVLTIDAATPGATAVTRTMAVPTGMPIVGIFGLRIAMTTDTGDHFGFLSPLTSADLAASETAHQVSAEFESGVLTAAETDSAEVEVQTNSSGQIRSRYSTAGANHKIQVRDLGWIDYRGKDNL